MGHQEIRLFAKGAAPSADLIPWFPEFLEEDMEDAVRYIHQEFGLGKQENPKSKIPKRRRKQDRVEGYG